MKAENEFFREKVESLTKSLDKEKNDMILLESVNSE